MNILVVADNHELLTTNFIYIFQFLSTFYLQFLVNDHDQ